MSLLDSPIIPSEKDVAKFRELMIKNGNASYSEAEAREGAYNLLNVVRVLISMDRKLSRSRVAVIGVLKKIQAKNA